MKQNINFLYLFLLILFPRLIEAQIQVVVSIPPQKTMVTLIGQDKVNVTVLIPANQSPAHFSPSIRQIQGLMAADVYFYLDAFFEKHVLSKIPSNSKLIKKNTAINIKKQKIDSHSHTSSSSDKNSHSHHLDPHIWLSPLLVIEQLKVIKNTLIQIDPTHQSFYESHFLKFKLELENLHASIKKTLAPFKNKKILVFHPAFGYFLNTYDLKQVAIEIDGKKPTAQQIKKIVDLIKSENIQTLFLQPQFDQTIIKNLSKTLKINISPLDPLNENIIDNFNIITNSIVNSLSLKSSP